MAVAAVASLVATAGSGAIGRRRPRAALPVAQLAPLAALGLAVAAPSGTLALGWVPSLDLQLVLLLDPLARILLALLGVVGVVVFAWARAITNDADSPRLAVLLAAFVTSMAGLLLSDGVLTLILFWEATSVLSYLLVGFADTDAGTRLAARRALLVTGAGGLALLVGLVLLAGAGVTRVSQLTTLDPGSGVVIAAAWLVLVGALTKSAQVPFHGWLGGAMAAPTPASALLHSATMVIAGVWLVLRTAPIFAGVPGWTTTTVVLGLLTFVWGSVLALRADDSKQLLAATTAAQLGLAFALAGVGTGKAALACLAVLLAHGLYKSGLFLTVGTAEKVVGSREVAALPAAMAASGGVRIALLLGAASLAGLPPLAAWVAKEAAVAAFETSVGLLGVVAVAVGAALSVMAAGRLLGLVGRPVDRHSVDAVPRPPSVTAPAVVLAGLAVLGAAATPLEGPVVAAAATLFPDATQAHLVVFPGFVSALAWSVAGILLGVALLRPVVARARAVPAGIASSDVTDAAISGSEAGASWLATRIDGWRRSYHVVAVLGSVLAVIAPLAAIAFVRPGVPLGPPLELVAAAAGTVAAVAIVLVRRSVVAALLLGVVGYSMGGIFLLVGAPDLALTQVLVETVVVVAFAGALRFLPDRLEGTRDEPTRPAARTRWAWLALRGVLAVSAAVVTVGLAVAGRSAGDGVRPVAELALAQAEPVGSGSNVVNVILTDFRALDTLGEVTVLACVGLGLLGVVGRIVRSDRTGTASEGPP